MSSGLDALDTLVALIAQAADEEGCSVSRAFVLEGVALLTEAGELTGPEVLPDAAGQICALDWDDDTGRLTVILSDYSIGRFGSHREVDDLSPIVREASGQIDRLLSSPGATDGEERESGRRTLAFMADIRDRVAAVRISVLSTGSFERTRANLASVAGLEADLAIWDAADLAGLVRHSSARDQVIDFSGLPRGGLPALGPVGGSGSESFLLVLPGDVVADLYQAHGAAILGRNVRAFLQSGNRVNKGIRTTAKEDPGAFFAFNNGLSLTARGIERALSGGTTVISRLTGLEIVNGGQTTASLHSSKYHDHIDLTDISVQAKLTIINGDDDGLALDIARFANSQSPVRMGDLTSNSPFFIDVERLSRSVAFGGSDSSRSWFFERLRGQFATERAASRALGAESRFSARYSLSRRFDKADLAKFELAWLQYPHIVAAGAERSLAAFTNLENGPARGNPDELYFRLLIGKAILWQSADRIVRELALGGYKATDVAYSVALIANRTAGRVDLERVADEQDAGEAWRSAVQDAAPLVHDRLIATAGARNVSTWSKSPSAWLEVQGIEWTAPPQLITSARVDATRTSVAGGAVASTAADEAELAGRQRVIDFGGAEWFQLSGWAKDVDALQSWQRGIAYSMGRLVTSGRAPTAKQVVQAVKILDEAQRLGFRPEAV